MTAERAKWVTQGHRAGVCRCVRCRHPLLVDLPPPRPKGKAARQRLLAQILDETRPGSEEEEEETP